eukprot:184016-Alexandrium_andersonii.AAC.1
MDMIQQPDADEEKIEQASKLTAKHLQLYENIKAVDEAATQALPDNKVDNSPPAAQTPKNKDGE